MFFSDPGTKLYPTIFEQTREDQFAEQYRRAFRLMQLKDEEFRPGNTVYYMTFVFGVSIFALTLLKLPVSLSIGMYSLAIDSLGDDEQREAWLPLARQVRTIGCYG